MKKLRKTDLNQFVKTLLATRRVFTPTEVEAIWSFREVGSLDEMSPDYGNSKVPPKGVFFPQSEAMFRYGKEEGKVTVASTEEVEGGMVLFGVRPCDLKSMDLLSLTFDGEDCRDVYFLNKRENTVLVGLGCTAPRATCFCTSFGIGPFFKEGCDLFLTDIGSSWLVDTLTKEGEELTQKGPFQNPTDEDLKQGQEVAEKAAAKVSSKVQLGGLKEKLDGMVDSSFWRGLHERCLGCAVCTYLCPTCYCFDIQDEARGSSGQRVRNWDTCMFPLYTLETSGHNPRPTGKERWRQRLNHKFNYHVAQYGQPACVGCGRCIVSCPVNIDIRNVVGEALAWEEPPADQ